MLTGISPLGIDGCGIMSSLRYIIFVGIFLTAAAEHIPGGRIVGGEETTVLEYPYQAAILFVRTQRCGAAVLSERWAITTASCISEINEPLRFLLTIRVGSSQRDGGGVEHAIESFVIHEKHVSSAVNVTAYDVALVKASWPFEFSPSVQPVGLPEPNEIIPADAYFHVTGWGSTHSIITDYPEELHRAIIPVVDQTECREAFPWESMVTDAVFCAGSPAVGICHGDTGAPLVRNWILYGVATKISVCMWTMRYGPYARIPILRTWITENTGL